jgi:hypothetical protein
MLGRALAVLDAGDRPIAGRIEIDEEETRWRFHPEGAWKPGGCTLVAAVELEDVAGNSIARLFEVDVVRPVERALGSRTARLPFEVKSP